MKVVQINVIYKDKSTGRTCWEVEKFLEQNGGESLTIHQLGPTSDLGRSYVINTRIGYYFHKFMSRLTGLDGYYSYFATKKAIKLPGWLLTSNRGIRGSMKHHLMQGTVIYSA